MGSVVSLLPGCFPTARRGRGTGVGGPPRRQIFVYFLEQGLAPGFVGSVVGALLGYGVALGLAALVGQTQEVAVAPIVLSLPITLISIVAGVVVVAASSFSP